MAAMQCQAFCSSLTRCPSRGTGSLAGLVSLPWVGGRSVCSSFTGQALYPAYPLGIDSRGCSQMYRAITMMVKPTINLRLSKSRGSKNGVAAFVFEQPSVFGSSSGQLCIFSRRNPNKPNLVHTSCISFHSGLQNASETDVSCVSSQTEPNVIDVLEERGLIESITSENLRSACSCPNASPVKVYCGFDPTAESLHLGNLIGIIVLSWFQRLGHRTVALIGGATGRIGDPSGKSIERPELDIEAVEKNTVGIENILSEILGRRNNKNFNLGTGSDKSTSLELARFEENAKPNLASGENTNAGLSDIDSFTVLNNFDWWKEFKLLDFLREVGRYARVGVMLSKESVRTRLESEEGISYTEFTYQLLQGYDFLHLFKDKGVNVQIGGSDQWGNITAGTELIRKKLQAEGAYGLTFPLLLKSDGTKFGKSEGGAIWLSSSMLSPYKFYQYFFSVPDVDVVRFLKILTFLSMEEIAKLEEEMKKPGYVPNSVQKRLAEEVTRFVHGEEGLLEASKATEALRPGAETKLDWKTIEGIAEDVPSCALVYGQVLNSSLVDLSVLTGLFGSKSAARRMVKQGGLYLNNVRIDSEDKVINEGDIIDGKILLLSAGKKNKMVVRIS